MKRLVEFGFVQGLVQVFTAISGLLIVRSLSKPEYALFAVTNSMQTACNILADVGIGIGVRSIGGKVWQDRNRFGQLLKTALGMRRRFAALSMIVCLPITAWLLWRNGATAFAIVGLSVVVVAGVIPLLASSVFNVSVLLHGEYRRMQKLDFGNAVARLALIGVLAASRINALLAASVGAIGNWTQAFFYRRWAAQHADPLAPTNEDDRRELLRLSKKSLPNAIFFCFQGQITLVVLSLFGNSAGVANVTALGRLAALLGVFSVAFSSMLAPRFARCQEPKRLQRLYWLFVVGSVLVLAQFVMMAWIFPGPLLWLLGGKYQSLGPECFWVVAAGCVSQVGGILWSLNSSKAWIRVQAPFFIPVVLAVQVLAALCLDLRTFHDVLLFNFAASVAPLMIYLPDAYLGLRLERRSVT